MSNEALPQTDESCYDWLQTEWQIRPAQIDSL